MSCCSPGLMVWPLRRFAMTSRTFSGPTPGGNCIVRPPIVIVAAVLVLCKSSLDPPRSSSARKADSLIPRIPAVADTSRSVRNAITGTVNTLSLLATETSISAFIPGSKSPSGFCSEIRTANIVTFCSTTACGSIFVTSPPNGWFG